MDKRHCLFSAITLCCFLSFCLAGCSKDPGQQQVDPKQRLLQDMWELYLKPTLSKAKIHSEKLKRDTKTFCAGNGSSLKDLKTGWKETYKYLERQDFFDIIPQYRVQPYTGELRKSLNTKPVKASDLDSFLAGTSDIAKSEVKSEALQGLPVVEYLLYGGGGAPQPGDRKCDLLQVVTELVAEDIASLDTAWQTFHVNLTDPKEEVANVNRDGKFKTSKDALAEVVEHIAKTIHRVNETYIADPSNRQVNDGHLKSSGSVNPLGTEAPYAELGAWVVDEMFIKGVRALYKGNYEGQAFGLSIKNVMEKEDSDGVRRVDDNFRAVEKALEAFMSRDTSLEASIKGSSQQDQIEKLILALNELEKSFRTDIPRVLGTVKEASSSDND